jgi:fatty acid-binding protein DegV
MLRPPRSAPRLQRCATRHRLCTSAWTRSTILRKGGRIGTAKAAIGGLLSIKPIITVTDGIVVVTDQPRTRSKATERVLELLTDRPSPSSTCCTRRRRTRRLPRDGAGRCRSPAPKVVTTQIIGPVIGAHIGPGAYGGILVRED